ncbi:P-loop containing nucleoside triphosphate hydrolases superfamily protein [Quillaja saponaria]|uniref:P-loop containing nucleoside triphosphate hydrolases superfamily protein n=1 Tax=Quillaja saponaria TaxID=32244 RepID=A0AAD7LPB0_QUISA|nr:P-loop containing nucleoside triphosphate hydrolases superfamily protein [Quillaja saponaria]
MGGDCDYHGEESSLGQEISLLSSENPTFLRDNSSVEVEEGTPMREREIVPYKEVLLSYDELRIRCKNLKEAKGTILSYNPGAWIETVGGLKLTDYDVPKTTSLILIGPRGSGKSSLVNRISKVFEVDKFASVRAQVSYNSSIGDGTYFLQEYMIPRDSTSICLYDTRSLCDDSRENNKMLKRWMTKGVHHGELVIRGSDSRSLRTTMKSKALQCGYFSSEKRKVNFVILVVNGLSVRKSMENVCDLEMQYSTMVASTFNCPYLSFRDDKPVIVVTHGDLLSLSDRARVRAYLGELLGVPPTKQIFDIPECDSPVTELAIIDMLRYSLEHADKSLPQKKWFIDKVYKLWLSLCIVLVILGITVASAHERFRHTYNSPQVCTENNRATTPKPEGSLQMKPHREWHEIRYIW